MESQSRVVCQLCFSTAWENNFEEVGDSMKDISEVIFINKNLQLMNGQVICPLCSRKLQNAFNFKCMCIYIEDSLFPFTKAIETPHIDLRAVYIKKFKNEGITNIPEYQRVCRLCLQLVYKSFTSLLDTLEQDMIRKLIPDLAIQKTINPVACETCTKSLYEHYSFINDCLYIHEKKINATYINKKLSTESFKRKDVNLTINEETFKIETIYNEGYGLCHPASSVSACTDDSPLRPNLSEPGKTEGENEDDKCSVLYDLDLHVMRLKEPNGKNPERETDGYCRFDYKSKYRNAAKKRLPPRKGRPNSKTFACEECGYHTKYANALKSHKLNHKLPSEIALYECDECDYKTKYRNALKSHRLNHTPVSQIRMRECELCPYKTKHRTALVLHMLKHKKPSEIKMYKCDRCDFQTKFKHALKPHTAKHRDV